MKNKLTFLKFCSKNTLSKDPIYKLISKFDDIQFILNNYKTQYKKIFYFNGNINNILRENDKKIIIEKDLNNISELYYLSLLMDSDKSFINYICFFKNIDIIYNNLKKISNNNKNYYGIIIIYKIINSFISNFKQQEEEEEEYEDDNCEEKINIIIDEINGMINELDIFKNKKDKCNAYLKKNIDSIYLEILSSLIEENKFNDYNYCYDIIKKLDLINIDITPTIYKGLSKILNKENKYMEKYLIRNEEDLKVEEKINFFYILIKYIFKNTIYIYNIDFLYENFNNFKKLTKNMNNNNNKIIELINLLELFNNKENVDIINDSNKDSSSQSENQEDDSIFSNLRKGDYSSREYLSYSINNQNNNISNSDITTVDNTIFKNKIIEKDKAKKILNKLNFKMNIIIDKNGGKNIKYTNIFYGLDNYSMEDIENLERHFNYNEKIKDENLLNEDKIIYENYKRLLFFLEEIEEYIILSKIKPNNSEITFEIKKINEKKNNNKNIYYLKCIYTLNNNLKFIEQNILEDSINSHTSGFIYLINELTNDDYINI